MLSALSELLTILAVGLIAGAGTTAVQSEDSAAGSHPSVTDTARCNNQSLCQDCTNIPGCMWRVGTASCEAVVQENTFGDVLHARTSSESLAGCLELVQSASECERSLSSSFRGCWSMDESCRWCSTHAAEGCSLCNAGWSWVGDGLPSIYLRCLARGGEAGPNAGDAVQAAAERCAVKCTGREHLFLTLGDGPRKGFVKFPPGDPAHLTYAPNQQCTWVLGEGADGRWVMNVSLLLGSGLARGDSLRLRSSLGWDQTFTGGQAWLRPLRLELGAPVTMEFQSDGDNEAEGFEIHWSPVQGSLGKAAYSEPTESEGQQRWWIIVVPAISLLVIAASCFFFKQRFCKRQRTGRQSLGAGGAEGDGLVPAAVLGAENAESTAAAPSTGEDAITMALLRLAEKCPVEPLGDKPTNDTCPICLVALQPKDSVRHLLCPAQHAFHPACIDCWFSRSMRCPLCNFDHMPLLSQSSTADSMPSQVTSSEEVADDMLALVLSIRDDDDVLSLAQGGSSSSPSSEEAERGQPADPFDDRLLSVAVEASLEGQRPPESALSCRGSSDADALDLSALRQAADRRGSRKRRSGSRRRGRNSGREARERGAEARGMRGHRFKLELQRASPSIPWGIYFFKAPLREQRRRIVSGVQEGSPAERWQMSCVDQGNLGQLLRRGDRLTEVNGSRGLEAMDEELARSSSVTLVFRRTRRQHSGVNAVGSSAVDSAAAAVTATAIQEDNSAVTQ